MSDIRVSEMNALAPFEVRPELRLADAWLVWVAAALRGEVAEASPPDFQKALPALAVHGVLPRLYICLRDSTAWSVLPPDFAVALASAYRTNAARAFLLEQEVERVATALSPDVPVALLKGLAIGRAVYGSPAERPVSDIDLLVPSACVSLAVRRMRSAGFVQTGLRSRGPLDVWLRRYRAELPFVRNVAGIGLVLVELHWSLVELPFYIDRIPSRDLWRPATMGTSPIIPDCALMLLHACIHAAAHHSNDLRLMWLVDVQLLAASPMLNWREFLDRTRVWRLGALVSRTLRAACVWPGAHVASDVMAEAEELAADRVGAEHWGIGDERPDRALRKARASLLVLPPLAKLRYAAWLLSRLAARPWENDAAGTSY